MKKILFGVLLLPALAFAEPVRIDKPLVCDDAKIVINSLVSGEYKEVPVWLGNADENDSKYAVLFNGKTKTWTIIQFNQQTACILGTGKDGLLSDKKHSF